MDLARARYLVSNPGREALESLDPRLSALAPHQLAARLRRSHGPAEASALAEQITLRARARARFGDDHRFLYSPLGLEMMTHPLVATRRAARLAAGGLPVADLTCGIGGDLSAISASAGPHTVGLDIDPVTALLASTNVPAARVIVGDAGRPPLRLAHHAILIDPSRRAGARRRFDPAAFAPTWSSALAVAAEAPVAVIKGPPGLDLAHVPVSAELEFVQVGKGLRESTLWFGGAAQPGLRRAVLLPAGATLTSDEPEVSADVSVPRAVIFDPESCVTRAGLVRHLAHALRARLMDSKVAYLTGDAVALHTLADAFEVLDIVPFSVARLRTRLREGRWRPDQIRRRAFPVEPDELRQLLGGLDGDPVTLLCTTIGRQRTIFIAREIPRSTEHSPSA